MVFYKGSLHYDRLQDMGIVEIYELTNFANKIRAEMDRKK